MSEIAQEQKNTVGMSDVMAQLGAALTQGLETRMNELEKTTRDKLAGIEELATKKRPVLRVKIGAGEERKLKSKAVPYLDRMITFAKCGMSPLLVGPAGCGKTTAAAQLADALGLAFGSLCFSAGASEAWLFGRHLPSGFVPASFAERYEHGGVFLGDEIDAADPNMMMSLNTALANGSMYNPMTGKQVARHKDFVFVGGANTVGKGADFVYTARNRLDGSSLDRFVTIRVDYDSDYEAQACPDEVLFSALTATRKQFREEKLEEILSTRTFERCYTLKQAKLPMTQIIEAIALSWSDEAKKILKDSLKAAKHAEGAKEHKEAKGEDDEIPF